MAPPPSTAVPTISPAEMQILVSRAGLVLNPGQVADLVLAWRQVAGLIASIPQERKLVDDLAYSFRVSPPAAAMAPQPRQSPAPAKPKPAAKRAAAGAAKAKRAAAAKANPKRAVAAKAKSRRTAKPKARGRATRRR